VTQEKKVINDIDDCTTFEEIAEIREGWYREYVRNGDNLKELLTGGYKEAAHFLLELIQNAEDVDASEVNIKLLDGCLIFSHNGTRYFDIDDIRSITGICKTTKKTEDNKIGRFGIGFKSVFSICETPRIYSTPYAFELRNIRVPHKIEMPSEYRKGTHFVLPFASEDKTVAEIYDLLYKSITELSADSILFLRKIKKISWEANGQKGYYKKEKPSFTCGNRIYFECGIKSSGKPSEKYLFFERALTGKEKLFISLAYRISDDENGKRSIVMEQGNTKLFVSFPMQGEDTSLRFKVNGPYATTHTRDTLSEKYATDNAAITAETILLYKDSLRVIKDLGLFDVSVLILLPIDSSILRSSTYKAFHEATVELFKAEAFLPTAKAGFTKPVDAILVGSEKLVELLNVNDSKMLFKGRCKWLDASITSTSKATKDIYFFIRDTLKAIDVDLAVFARSVTDEFLASKGDKWLIKFYKLLASSPFAMGIIKDKAVVRLESGKMVAPFAGDTPNAHLQREGMKPTAKSVKHIFCEDNDALEFLGFFGVTTADIVDDIRDFTSELSKCKDEADYLLVMELIADAYNDKDTTEDKRRRIAAILQAECSILCEDENRENMEKDKDNIERYRRQLQLYAYIIEQRYGLSVSKMHIYYTGETEGIPTVSYDNRASDMTKTVMAIDKTVRKIQCKDFTGRATSEKLCRSCDLRYFCGRI
jgi:CRISPR/Cas system-associated exonuclease Cas4 (RecB family)